MSRDPALIRSRGWVAIVAITLVAAACGGQGSSSPPSSTTSTPTTAAPPGGALDGVVGLAVPVEEADRARLVEAADDLVDHQARPTDPLQVEETDAPFVTDAQAAWTLALAGHLTGDERYSRSAAAIVSAWVDTARSTEDACPRSGACSTSLMVSRAAPALVFAVDVLAAAGRYPSSDRARFHSWLRKVILPAASDRDNNWGDAGTYLRAVVAAELGDRDELDHAARLWRHRLDLVEPDGRIPEEMRRGDASLMYSQDALDYKVATADVLDRAGIDVWDERGSRGGTLEGALELVARGLADPGGWPGGEGDLRIPDPSGVWAIASLRWPSPAFRQQAGLAATGDGKGHSAVIWTRLTHPVRA